MNCWGGKTEGKTKEGRWRLLLFHLRQGLAPVKERRTIDFVFRL